MGITRRDLINGTAVGLGVAATWSPAKLFADVTSAGAPPFPPTLTGMRGTSDTARDVGHAMVLEGKAFSMPGTQTDETYDLVVVGGGVSGLAAALFFQEQAGPDTRILILENHDDFGGHAQRNEFEVDGRKLISYAGVQNLVSPNALYSQGAPAHLLKRLGIDPAELERQFDRDFFKRHGLTAGIFFDRKNFGERSGLRRNPFYNISVSFRNTVLLARDDKAAAAKAIDAFPVSGAAKANLKAIVGNETNFYESLSFEEWMYAMATVSYRDYVKKHFGLEEEAWLALRGNGTLRWSSGIDWDRENALIATSFYMPGLGIDIYEAEKDHPEYYAGQSEPYIHHFPDGGASVARNIVRLLVPPVTGAKNWQELVTASIDYAQLDRADHAVRLRLGATAVRVENSGDGKLVDIAYVDNRSGETHRVRGKHAIMACWNGILPWICPQLPDDQRESLRYARKAPLTYVQIALRNWESIAASGYGTVHHTGGFFSDSTLDFPISVGGYRHPSDPKEPIVLTGFHSMRLDLDPKVSNRDHHVAARHWLMNMSFDEFERGTLEYLDEIYGPWGLDASRDVAAITVNRWPHGPAYYYNPLYDDPSFHFFNGPHITGRQQLGRISIANSDSEANPFLTGAIDAAARAVNEQLGSE